MRLPRLASAFVLASLLAACGRPASPAPPPSAAAEPAGPFAVANHAFHADYDRLLALDEAALGTTLPFIVVDGSRVTFRFAGETLERRLFIDRYQDIKSACHLPIAVVTFLMALRPEAPGPEEARRIVELRRAIAALEPAIAPDRVGADLVEPQRRVLRATAALLDEAETRGRPTDAVLRAYGDGIRADLTLSLSRASWVLLEALHAAVGEMRARAGDAWGKTLVLVSTVHQARARETTVQYFERLLGERMAEGALGEGRLIVTEGAHRKGSPERLVAAHLLDARLATLLFGDPLFMQSDLLGKFAGPHVEKLLPEPASRLSD